MHRTWKIARPCLFFFVLSSRADLASIATLLVLLVDEAWEDEDEDEDEDEEGAGALPAV